MPKRDRSKQSTSLTHVVDMANMVTLQGLGEEVYKVTAIMFHPNDAAARRTFIESSKVDMTRRLRAAKYLPSKIFMEIPAPDVDILNINRLLDEAMPVALTFKGAKGKNGDGDGYTGTAIAAAILARALTAADQGNSELGIAQIISDQGDEYRREGVKNAGRDTLTKVWQDYRAIAHISLACLEMGPNRRPFEDPRVFFDWISRSEDLLRAGSAIGNRFATPILPKEECWSLVVRPSLGG